MTKVAKDLGPRNLFPKAYDGLCGRAWDGDDPAAGSGQVDLAIRGGSGQALFRLSQVSILKTGEDKALV